MAHAEIEGFFLTNGTEDNWMESIFFYVEEHREGRSLDATASWVCQGR